MRNALLLIALSLGFGLAQAQAPIEAEVAPAVAAAEADSAASKAKADRLAARHCIRDTGTRLRVRDKDGCIANAPGRAYSRTDIERTGETDVASALRRLDPSITSHGN